VYNSPEDTANANHINIRPIIYSCPYANKNTYATAIIVFTFFKDVTGSNNNFIHANRTLKRFLIYRIVVFYIYSLMHLKKIQESKRDLDLTVKKNMSDLDLAGT
jgi:hypothetical protein